jgi:DNA-binding LacI/PurR family transcriptional regulator/AraC-like DNA-binding protein
MAAERKKVGLALASIHTGVAQNIWPAFARIAAASRTSLFIFPGGRLNAAGDFENLRNPVYALINDENLDGCISWSSAIRYTQSPEEFEQFHANFDPLPYVTIADKVPGHPCVEFNAYSGIKALVSHCIDVHGARKIAFLRGPGFHRSARARFEGYWDALKEAGLIPPGGGAAASPLVTEPFNWSDGAGAAAQLFESRSLIPGRDFDTLIGSSDLMTRGAMSYFAEKGYHVPGDYHAGGFNNSVESRITESPLSTVHLPYAELCGESFAMLLKLMGRNNRVPVEDVLLRSEVIIRESCGCVDRRVQEEGPAPRPPASERPDSALMNMAKNYLKFAAADPAALVQPLIRVLLGEDTELAFPLFEKALVCFFDAGGEAEDLLRYIAAAGGSGLVSRERARRLEPALCGIVCKVRERLSVLARYEKEQWNTVLNSLKCDLLGTRDRLSLVRSLTRHLPKIGIHTAAIVLYGDEKTSVCVGGFSPEGANSLRDQRFPARLLVPAALRRQYTGGVFMVQPLFIENQSLGYFAHNVPLFDGVIFEELRSAVSYALKGIFLLEETVRAKQIAEQAERAKTEFLKTLEHGLYEPLQGVMERLEELERRRESPADLAGGLEELKSFVAAREAQAGSMVDFTLARIDELGLRKSIFDPAELLPGIGTLPLLSGDVSRLAQCFSLVREEYAGTYGASPDYGGLSIVFRGTVRKRRDAERRFGLPLAERIVLMHGGEFRAGRESCVILLPWTTLSGQEPAKGPRRPGDQVLVLSDPASLPAGLFELPLITDLDKARTLPGRIAFIAWNSSGADQETLVKVAGLRRTGEFAAVPFLCYGAPDGAFGSETSVIEAVEHALQSPLKGTVLWIGPSEGRDVEALFPDDETEHPGPASPRGIKLETFRIPSMAAFNDTVGELCPSLVVCGALDPAAAAAIRRHPLTATVPIVMIGRRIDDSSAVSALSQYSRLIICHQAAASSPEFRRRLRALAGGDRILPPHTGVLVKKAILYLGRHAESHISRWKLADAVNVSEDYLTRIFHREMGLSLWDYLNRCRMFLASELLRQTDAPIQDIAFRTGFQDQTYFCRVFKKIHGVSPGQLRKH